MFAGGEWEDGLSDEEWGRAYDAVHDAIAQIQAWETNLE